MEADEALLREHFHKGFCTHLPAKFAEQGSDFLSREVFRERSSNKGIVKRKLEGRAMNRIRQTISLALVVALVSIGLTAAQAQRTYQTNDRQVSNLIRRVELSTQRFRSSVEMMSGRGQYNGTNTRDQLNSYLQNFESATVTLRDRVNQRGASAADVQNVLQQASLINSFLLNNRAGTRIQSDWSLVRTDLDALARAYSVTWDWNQNQTGSTYGTPGYGYPSTGQPYRVNDRQVDALLRRIANESDTFRNDLGNALNRSTYNGTRAEDNINQFVSNFADATAQLRSRFDARQAAASDVQSVLSQATYIDDFVRRNRLPYRAQNDWTTLKGDLNQLASAYNVTWNWDVRSIPTVGTTADGGVYGTDRNYGANGRLTGTFRLDPSRSDDANAVADRAVSNLSYNERQQVRDQIMRRLVAPDMLAIERSGSSVTIASSRAPQTTFVANGVESREQLPNGSYSRVTAQLNGDQLIVRSAGNRTTDFNVTFDPIEGGQRLRVTRQIWNDQLGQNPVVVQNVYDRTSDVAQWNVYNGSTQYGQTGSIGPNGDFIVPDGTMLTATLDTDLTTQTANTGDRFTMTVTSPSQFAGSVIEGHVANVSRSGRVTGRSVLSLNFDDIRARDGRTYQFAGFLDSVRTSNGETVQVDNEGTVRDQSQTRTTEERAAIGTAVGAIIGAIAGGGKGAAIGAVLGAGAGAGSVYAQGRDDLNISRGTEVTIRASAPNR
jgi:hypothetical protein